MEYVRTLGWLKWCECREIFQSNGVFGMAGLIVDSSFRGLAIASCTSVYTTGTGAAGAGEGGPIGRMDWFQGSIGKVYGVFGKYEAAALRPEDRSS